MSLVGEVLQVRDERKRVAGILWTEEKIQKRIKEIARDIEKHYFSILQHSPDANLVLVGILNGVIPFMGDLIKELSRLLPPDRLRYDTLAISSYGVGTSPGELRVEKDLKNPIAGDHVLIVEDIIDTGYTAKYFKQLLIHKGALSVLICALAMKDLGQEHEVIPDFLGFTIDKDLFIVGYGLDWADLWRFPTSVAYLEDIK